MSSNNSSSNTNSCKQSIPSEEELLAACRPSGGSSSFADVDNDNNMKDTTTLLATTLLLQSLDAVIAASRSPDMEDQVETAARASEVLTGTLETLKKNDDGSNSDTSDSTTSSSLRIFQQALTTAVWWLTCQHSDLASNTALVSVLKTVLEQASSSSVAVASDPYYLANSLLQTVGDTNLLKAIVPGLLVPPDASSPPEHPATTSSATTDIAKKLRLTNTSVFYRQHKYNLLAEESEGYSKFLYLLQQQQQQHRMKQRRQCGG